jgi:Ca-activated chloride channel family protein
MSGFAAPGWLGLLGLVAVLAAAYVVAQIRRKKYVVRFANVSLLAGLVPRRPGWRRHLTFALLLGALAVFTVDLAQPTAAVRVPSDRATVMLGIDVSPSMVATDVLPSRLQASQAGAKLFADILLVSINLGLVKFGGTASVVVPPTLDRTAIKTAIDNL